MSCSQSKAVKSSLCSATSGLQRMRRRLQDFLGGNAKCVVMANISGATSHAAHTAHTLAFARRAKNIVNVVRFRYLVTVSQQCTQARCYMFRCAPDEGLVVRSGCM